MAYLFCFDFFPDIFQFTQIFEGWIRQDLQHNIIGKAFAKTVICSKLAFEEGEGK